MSDVPASGPVGRIGVFPGGLDWDKSGGLLPVVVQDADNLRVLMLGYMDREALQATLSRRLVTFYSRSKGRLWTKGETSGHVLEVVDIQADCDADALLVLARPQGPTCHLQRPSCFEAAPHASAPPPRPEVPDVGFLARLDALVAGRERERPEGSYTTRLFESGVRRIAQKVGEEGVETALAGVAQNDTQLLGEVADLIYHVTVLLHARRLSLTDAVAVLEDRHATRAGG